MQEVLVFLVGAFFQLLFFVFLLRLMLQLVRADFRNPVSQAIVRLTNWLIMPLRRVLPPIGRIDTASITAVVLVALAQVAALSMVRGLGLPEPLFLLQAAVLEILRTILTVYFWAILVYALLSMVAPGAHSPFTSLLESLCEPVLAPIRRTLPAIGGLDLSPLWASIGIQVLLILLR